MTWINCRLGDVLTLARGFDLPTSQRKNGEIPVVSSSGVTGYHSESKLQGPGVVTGRYGTIGEVYFIEGEYWPLNTALYVSDFKGNSEKFSAYFLQYVLSGYQSDKAAVPGVNRNVLHELPVTKPDRELQERIAGILTPYDELIENNRRRMALLEDAARQLYSEWFVRQRFPGREHTVLVDGLPYGWQTTTLDQITAKIGSGATPRGGEVAYISNGIPLFRSQNVYDDGFEEKGLAFIAEDQAAALNGAAVQSRDILLNITGASVARCCMAPERYLPARVNQHVMIIRVDPAKASPFFVHAAINSDHNKRKLLSYAQKGSTREALTKEMVANFAITLPVGEVMRAFDQFAESCFSQRENLATQNQKLRAARDLLLPRLMNREIPV